MTFSVSLLACAFRWARMRERGALRHAFAVLASLQGVLLLDIAFDWRWKLHAFWADEAQASGVYGERRGPQLLLLNILLVVMTLVSIWVVYRLRFRLGLALAVTGTLGSIGVWCCEAVSYHFVDAVFYRMLGGVMLVSLLWVCLMVLTCVGVWLAGRALPREIRRL